MQIPLIGGAYSERSPDLNAQTCVNLYPVTGGPDGRTVSALYSTPGLRRFTTIGTTPVRGMHRFGGLLLAVSGDTLYKVDSAGVATACGTLATASGPVCFADNGQRTLLVDGAGGYLWDGIALSPVTDPDFPAATQVAFLGGYFIVDNPAQPGQFMVSILYATDPANLIDALDFATAESDPDGLIALTAHAGHLWLFGRQSTEVWFQSGEVFPFNPVGGARSDRGCAAARSVARAGESLLWLANDANGRLQIIQSSGSSGRVVSTPALEHQLAQYPQVADAVGYAYHQEGHTFYVLTLPAGNATWVYDLSTGLWHRRGGWNGTDWTRHKGDTYVHFAGQHLLGDFATGQVYVLDQDHYTDDGALLRRERTAPVLHADGAPLFAARLELFMQMGVGDVSTPAPTVMLDWSDDGGHRWSADQQGTIDGGIGATGRTDLRLRFHRLGRFYRRNFRLVVSDPVPVVLLGATLKVTTGR